MKNKLCIGLSTCGNVPTAELFSEYSKAGIDAMEISLKRDGCERIDFRETEKNAKDCGVKLWSFHLPFSTDRFSPDIASLDMSLRRLSIDFQTELIKKASDIGIGVFVIHPCLEPVADEDRTERMSAAKDSLAELAEVAGKAGGVLAVEDLPRSCLGRNAAEIEELISADPRLRICFDTNHLLTETPESFVRKFKDKILTLHVSDYDNVNERHWLPGEGIIDWHILYDALTKEGYTGPWLYELGFDCPKTIYRKRRLCCEDFVRNANEIFDGKPLTVISTPKPGIGMWE